VAESQESLADACGPWATAEFRPPRPAI
jgi:hypothetical protein